MPEPGVGDLRVRMEPGSRRRASPFRHDPVR
jgi:hypothetical protein